MAEGLVIGGWFASAGISKLSDLVRSYISDQYQYQTGSKSKLKRLQQSLAKIKAVIDLFERKGIQEEDHPYLVSWLNDLKDAVHDAEDILDLIEYKSLQHKIETSSKVRKFVKHAQTAAKRLFFSHDILNELSEVAEKFDNLASDGQIGTFLKVVELITDINREDETFDWRQTTAISSEPKLFGRKKEIDRLQKLLLSGSSGGNFSVVSIIGMGGVGKTTLAQTVYSDTTVMKHFDLMAWVCISDRFDFRRVMIEIMESAEKVANLWTIQNLTTIQEHLEKMLEGKRFLIVLDDAWDATDSRWEKLYSTFRSAKEGSRIVVTTRNKSVVRSVKSKEIIELEGLEDTEFWQFFKCCAFGDVNTEDHPKLEEIGRQIAKKLGRLPLAAKTVGAVLKCRLEEKHWRGVLEDKSWQNNKDGIGASLKLSYDHLRSCLKQCFVYCALFPKDYEFEKEILVHIWVALGYVQSSNGKKTLEDVGQEYFDELEHRCFFQKVYSEYYVIHDLLHDLAESLSKEEFYRQEEDKLETLTIPERVRHLFVSSTDLDGALDKIRNTKRLRSLVHEAPLFSTSEATSQELKTSFTKLSGLRILILGRHYSSLKFEDAINDMPHLRYLKFPWKMDLPFVGGLHHLQVLAHDDFVGVYGHVGAFKWANKSRAKILAKLVNLRYINVASCFLFHIPGIGQLTSLQRLSHYTVREKEGHNISELGNLRQIRDSLRIEGLEKVANKVEAKKAGLDNKQYLDKLELIWVFKNCSDEKLVACEEVLEGLHPHSNIKTLMIEGYMGFKIPDWFNKVCLSNINHIELKSCPYLKALPPLGEFSFLKDLSLRGLDSLENIGLEVHGEASTVFPLLENITLFDMKELREWSAIRKNGRALMPRLRKLSIVRCPKLKALPRIGELPLLEVMYLAELPSLEKVGSDTYGEGNIAFPSLQELKLENMPQLNEWSAPDQEHGQILWPRRRRLEIGGDISLHTRCIPANSLSSIQSLKIYDSNEIERFTVEEQEWFKNLTSLKELQFICCWDLRSLPDTLGSLSSLERLKIKSCHKMVSLGNNRLPPSLKKLTIIYCDELEKRCDWRNDERSSEWNKISHVPLIKIGGEYIPHPPPALPTQPSN